MKNRNSMKRQDTYETKDRFNSKSRTRVEVQDELYRKYQLSANEIDELKNSLYYVETKLNKEMDVKEELVLKAEKDRKAYIDWTRRLREQEEINKNQTKQISRLSDQLNEFTNSQDNIVRNLKEKFDDYNREMREKEEKILQLK